MDRLGVRAALATMLGLQALRVFFPTLVYVLRDRAGLNSLQLGGVAFLIFATTFLVPVLMDRRRRFATECVLVLVGTRIVLQLWPGDPIGTLVLATVGSLAFFGFLAAFARERRATPVLVGAAADASLFALFGTRDLTWGGAISSGGSAAPLGVVALVVTVVLAALLLRTTWRDPETTSGAPPPREPFDGSPLPAGLAALFVWGPYLALHLELGGNVARASALANLDTPTSGALVTAGLLAGAWLASHLPGRGFWAGAPSVLVAAVLLLRGLFALPEPGPLAPWFLAATQCAGAVLLSLALRSPASTSTRSRSVAFGLGGVTFLALLFAHYAGYAIAFPWTRGGVFLVAGLLLVVAATRRRAAHGDTVAPLRRASWALLVLPLIPLLRPVVFPAATALPRDDDRYRVVTFNLHNGFDELGGWALDKMLRHARAERPDAIALQEVSRGWVMNGCADVYELARHTLGLEGAFGPSVGGDWGNAIFARELRDVQTTSLPPEGLALPRRALGADVGPVRLVATHFHHLHDGEDIRDVEAAALADFAARYGDDPAVLAGDFNATPDAACFATLARAGWTDVVRLDVSPTYPSRAPIRRIDTVLVNERVDVREARVNPPGGSDHRSVTVDVALPR
jgi:endonuclease/exonuclease/phosphatase family metal-dependent hydrolase